jgi:hypothetical protein
MNHYHLGIEESVMVCIHDAGHPVPSAPQFHYYAQVIVSWRGNRLSRTLQTGDEHGLQHIAGYPTKTIPKWDPASLYQSLNVLHTHGP